MASQRNAGARIREKRIEAGLRQSSVAAEVGISASYLNLIEHDRRRIGGKLLADIARVLGVEASVLNDGADQETLDRLRSAAAQLPASRAEVPRADEFAARFPGWAALVVAQARNLTAMQEQVQVLTDRLTFDPQLARSLHDVISAVTAIRSSAGILIGADDLDADWQRRFHKNIHDDSLRLAASSEALISYLEVPEAARDLTASPIEQRDDFLSQQGLGYAEEACLAGEPPEEIAARSGLSGAGLSMLTDYLTAYAADSARLPLSTFGPAARAAKYDPVVLSQSFAAPFDMVLRRLASLRQEDGHPPMGLAVCDAAGVITQLKPVSGFDLPRAGAACPHWPFFAAAMRPGQPTRTMVEMPGQNPTRLLCYAVAITLPTYRIDLPQPLVSTMLVLPDARAESGAAPIPVGVACRICPRQNCPSRREPAIDGVQNLSAL